MRGIFTRTLLGWLEQRALAAAVEGSARSHSGDSAPSTSDCSRSSRSTWAELLRRVFAVDVLTCP